MKRVAIITLFVLLALSAVLAQRRNRGFGGGGYGGDGYFESFRTPREVPQHSYETPVWTNSPGFETDVFTFARIRSQRAGWGNGGWSTDAPDSDLNLSYRLQQVTAMKVDPNGLFLEPTDKDLTRYPFLYIVEPGSLYFTDEQAAAMRKHLLNGGFLMLDDFWGEAEWARMEGELKKVFPERSFVELPLDHPLYHCVFDIKEKGQVPNVRTGTDSQYTGVTWERADAHDVHHRVIFDDKGRIMVFAAHNTDNGDGWEWEGNNTYYFENFAEKTAYPLAINVIFYTMTH